jgi:hypothetical protein
VLSCEEWVIERLEQRRAGRSAPASAGETSASAPAAASVKQWLEVPRAWAAHAVAAAAPILATARQSLARMPRLRWPRAASPAGGATSAALAEPPTSAPAPEPFRIADPPREPRPEPVRVAVPPPEPIRFAEPGRTAAPTPAKPTPASKPPAPFQDVPVIALAELDEPTPDEDQFDDGAVSRVREAVETSWAWTKSLTVPAVLLVVIFVLVSNYKAWFPRAMATTMRLFNGMDELKARYAPPEASREALQAAKEQLPQLSPASIEAVMVRSGSPSLAPTEVFRRAAEATAKGKAALPPTAAGELDSHMAALRAELSESEAASLSRYMDRLAAGEAMLPYEDNEAMWLTARGARRLPAERLARVQQLSAQAITIGLGAKPAPEEPSLPSLPPLPSLPAFEGPSR